MRRISAIYSNEIDAGESVSFEYKPSREMKTTGFLFSSDIEVSMSFQSGTDLKFLRYLADSNAECSPNDRIIPFSEKIEGSVKGVITSIRSANPRHKTAIKHKVGVYLISQTNEN